jgi:hypothetical protein
VLSDLEVADKKQLRAAYEKVYNASYNASANGKEKRRQYHRGIEAPDEAGNKRARVLQERTWRAAADLPCSRRPTSRTWAALGGS